MGMKVLFLDVDGVLNNIRSRSIYAVSRPALRRLRRVLDETGADVVLSSTWRKLPQTREAFVRKTGIRPASVTPIHFDGRRGPEIARWLLDSQFTGRYAIVDDDSDMLPEQLPFFVQTRNETGLLDEHADRLIQILNGA